MFDFIPDFTNEVVTWITFWGVGFWAHKKVSINYKERWKQAVETLKQEQLNTNQLEETNPSPKFKPSNTFMPAGNTSEFRYMPVVERLKLEKERLAHGLPPKDSMRECNAHYHNIAAERLKHGWEWDEDDKGWYKVTTIAERSKEISRKDSINKAYNRGYSDGMSRHNSKHNWDY